MSLRRRTEYGIPRITIFILALVFASTSMVSMQLVAQPSEAEAKQIFENIGCTSCHVGQPLQPAASWGLVVQFMQDWSQKYPSIDEAIANEVTYYGGKKFQSFDELMAQMAQNVGRTPDDPEIQKLMEYFKSFWEEGTQAPPEQEQPVEEQPQEQAPTTEQPAEKEQPVEEQPTGVKGGEEPREGIMLTIISIALIIIISVVAAVYLTRR